MEREINKALPNSRASMSAKLKQYKRDVEIIEKDLVINSMIVNFLPIKITIIFLIYRKELIV